MLQHPSLCNSILVGIMETAIDRARRKHTQYHTAQDLFQIVILPAHINL